MPSRETNKQKEASQRNQRGGSVKVWCQRQGAKKREFQVGETANASLPGDSAGKESACSVGDLGSIPGLGRSPGEGKGYPLQCSGLENSMDSPWDHKESDTERLSRSLYGERATAGLRN